MNGQVLRVAWYRFLATSAAGGAATLAWAYCSAWSAGWPWGRWSPPDAPTHRRTDAPNPKFLASTNPSDLVVQPFTTPAYSPGFVRQLARLPL